MYWLMDYGEQEALRQRIIDLQTALLLPHKSRQAEQVFPYVGRKDRAIARKLVEHLSPEGGAVCDPFCGSGTFAYAALDCGRRALANEWEPYAYRMMTAPFRGVPEESAFKDALARFQARVQPVASRIYATKCPACGRALTFDALFFDRLPENYDQPTRQERMGPAAKTSYSGTRNTGARADARKSATTTATRR